MVGVADSCVQPLTRYPARMVELVDIIAFVGLLGVCYLAVKFGQWLRGDIVLTPRR